MPKFRYESVNPSGVPIHGVVEAEDHAALEILIAERGLKLVSAKEISLDSLAASNRITLPRLFQLRVGEQLREALLTGLPAAEAVRAIAREPISHPVSGLIPWLWGMSLLVFLAIGGFGLFVGSQGQLLWGSGAVAFVVMPLVAAVVHWLYDTRPKATLNLLAEKLEAGDSLPKSLNLIMPAEIRCVLHSDIDDSSKARVAADLIPGFLGGNFRVQQFVMTLIGPLLLLGVVCLGVHSLLLFVMPDFKQIFEDFGTNLPAFTAMVIGVSDIVASFGMFGWLVDCLLIVASGIFLTMALASNRGSEMLERIPVFGVAFRWAMQARVARVLSAMIRNGCSYSESIKTATAGSGFMSVRQQGEIIADQLETGREMNIPVRQLSGLPVSMLYVQESENDAEHRRVAVADTFHELSEMLEAATIGQGKLFAFLFQFIIVTFTGFVIGMVVLALFLPLIKLLNDLA